MRSSSAISPGVIAHHRAATHAQPPTLSVRLHRRASTRSGYTLPAPRASADRRSRRPASQRDRACCGQRNRSSSRTPHKRQWRIRSCVSERAQVKLTLRAPVMTSSIRIVCPAPVPAALWRSNRHHRAPRTNFAVLTVSRTATTRRLVLDGTFVSLRQSARRRRGDRDRERGKSEFITGNLIRCWWCGRRLRTSVVACGAWNHRGPIISIGEPSFAV
jgi:hypothetical protein